MVPGKGQRLDPDGVPIEEAARLTGLTPHQLRLYERRYGWPAPPRNYRGFRVFSEEMITEIQWVCQRMAEGERLYNLIHDGCPIGLRGAAEVAAARQIEQPREMRWVQEYQPTLPPREQRLADEIIQAIRQAPGRLDELLEHAEWSLRPPQLFSAVYVPVVMGVLEYAGLDEVADTPWQAIYARVTVALRRAAERLVPQKDVQVVTVGWSDVLPEPVPDAIAWLVIALARQRGLAYEKAAGGQSADAIITIDWHDDGCGVRHVQIGEGLCLRALLDAMLAAG